MRSWGEYFKFYALLIFILVYFLYLKAWNQELNRFQQIICDEYKTLWICFKLIKTIFFIIFHCTEAHFNSYLGISVKKNYRNQWLLFNKAGYVLCNDLQIAYEQVFNLLNKNFCKNSLKIYGVSFCRKKYLVHHTHT